MTAVMEPRGARSWRLWRSGDAGRVDLDDGSIAFEAWTMGEGRDGSGDLDSARRRRDGGDGTGRDEKTREAVRTLDFSNAGGESVGWDGGDAEEVVTMVSTSSWGSEEDAAARYASSESERFESEEEDDASGRLRRALDAVDAASREALAQNFSAVSVVTLSREMRRAREAAGVEDLRRMDSEESESEDADESRAARLELSRARYRAKVAEAEAVILRREADEAKKRCVETYGEEGRAWLESLQLRIDLWHDECERRLETLPGRYGRGESKLDAMAKETQVTWLQLQSSPTKRPVDECM